MHLSGDKKARSEREWLRVDSWKSAAAKLRLCQRLLLVFWQQFHLHATRCVERDLIRGWLVVAILIYDVKSPYRIKFRERWCLRGQCGWITGLGSFHKKPVRVLGQFFLRIFRFPSRYFTAQWALYYNAAKTVSKFGSIFKWQLLCRKLIIDVFVEENMPVLC